MGEATIDYEFVAPMPLKPKKKTTIANDGEDQKKRAPKKQQLTDARETVVNYMKEQNRPYSAQNIFDNLHHAISKPVLQKILDEASAADVTSSKESSDSSTYNPTPTSNENSLLCKEYGKFKVYLINQRLFQRNSVSEDTVNPNELERLNVEVQALAQEVKQLQRATAGDAFSKYSTEQLLQLNEQIKDDIKSKKEELKLLIAENQDSGTSLSNEEFMKLKHDRTEAVKGWKFRRDLCYRMLDSVALTLESSVPDVMFDLGIDPDEDFGVEFPSHP